MSLKEKIISFILLTLIFQGSLLNPTAEARHQFLNRQGQGGSDSSPRQR